MTQGREEQQGSAFGGVSLPSFLQMLEQERKSCTLIVQSDGKKGLFFFEGGELVDAVYEKQRGVDAAHTILKWPGPTFLVGAPEDRMRRIQLPLAHILLDAAKQMDEENGEEESPVEESDEMLPVDDGIVQSDPVLKNLVETITRVDAVRHFFLLDRQGKVLVQSSRRMKLGDFITYCIVSGIQMRKVLEASGPSRIHMVLDTGESLLIIPGAGLIIGLLLEDAAAVDEVAEQVRPALGH